MILPIIQNYVTSCGADNPIRYMFIPSVLWICDQFNFPKQLCYKHLFSTIIFVGFFFVCILLSTSTFVSYQYQYQYQYMRTLPVHAYILHSYQTQNSYMFIFNISKESILKLCFFRDCCWREYTTRFILIIYSYLNNNIHFWQRFIIITIYYTLVHTALDGGSYIHTYIHVLLLQKYVTNDNIAALFSLILQ